MSDVCKGRDRLVEDLLHRIRLRRCEYHIPEFRAPWSISVARKTRSTIYVVNQGDCWVEVSSVAEPMRLSHGDLALVVRGDRHKLSNGRSTLVLDFADLRKAYTPTAKQIFRTPGEGAISRFVCGEAEFETGSINLLASILPPVLTVTRTKEPWLELTTHEILTELNNGGPCVAEVLTRLTEMLLVRAIRNHLNLNMDTAQSGWLAAARDGHIGGALDILHREPQRNWTVDAMARSVALSRSAFAARFKELLG